MCLTGNNNRTNTGKIRRPERESNPRFPVFVLLLFPLRHIRVSLSDDEPVVRNVSYVYLILKELLNYLELRPTCNKVTFSIPTRTNKKLCFQHRQRKGR